MIPLSILALIGVAFAIPIIDLSLNSDNDKDASDDEPIDLEISEDGTYLGTDGNDTVTVTDDATIDLDTGAGDDIIQNFETVGLALFDSTIDGGDGDDIIDVDADSSTIHGGDGNDTITVQGPGSEVFGDAGDDFIEVSSVGDNLYAYGGDGNDTLQSLEPTGYSEYGLSDNVFLSGGAGDDVIQIYGPRDNGAGYVEVASGDAGDDTIIMTSQTATSEQGIGFSDIIATGGEGEDIFVLQAHDNLLDEPIEEGLNNGNLFRDGVVTDHLFTVTDFEPGVDQLSIEADAVTEGGVLASARLEENTDAEGNSLTELILTYENDAQQPVQVLVTLEGAAGVTWDDIEFDGDQVPVLTPLV